MDIIEKLKDDNEYYNGIGKNYLSNSNIGQLLKHPALFQKSEPDNKNFMVGRYFHQLILEPEKAIHTLFVDVASRNSKAYKEFCAEAGLGFALLEKEKHEVQGLVEKMLSNFTLHEDIRNEKCVYELPAVKEIAGEMWKGKADIVHPDMVIDLKTTADIHNFKWSAKKYNYDSQAFLYQELFGRPLVFYVICKTTGVLGVFEPSPQFIDGGEAKVRRAVEVYRKFYGKNPSEDIDTYYINEIL